MSSLSTLKDRFKKGLLLAGVLLCVSAPLVQAALDLELGEEGGVSQEDCSNLDESLAGALGCTGSDTVLDFTEYNGKLEPPDATGYDPALTESDNAKDFIKNIVEFALSFLGFVTVMIVVYGGILYVTSQGDDGQTEKAKNAIKFAVIGIIIIMGSYAFVNTILSIGGGSPTGGVTAGNSDGKTITEAGAAFDVGDALEEIESITVDFVKEYQDYLEISRQIDEMRALPIPVVMTVEENNYTLSELVEYAWDLAGGNESDYADQYVTTAQAEIDDYVLDLHQGISEIQSLTDPLSDTYEAAQQLNDYLQVGNISAAPWIPVANAAKDGEIKGKGCQQVYTDQSRTFGLGVNMQDTTLAALDDEICGMIASIQTIANSDYKEEINLLKGRFDDLRTLLDMGKEQEIGSDLFDIEELIKSANTQLDQVTNASVNNINNATVQNFTRTMNDLYVKVKEIEFVKVRLTASTVEGNSPLLVRFDILGTEDPSGVTVQNEQIQWDLNGNNKFDEESEKENLGETSISKIYTEAGTYRVKVRVLSSDKNIAAGVAAVTIEVAPAKSKIVINAKVGSDIYPVMDYTKNPALKQESFKITATEAKQAIFFDASKSTDGDGNLDGISYYQWDFGDSESVSGNKEQASAPSHVYTRAGEYTVRLTVTDRNGVEDTAYFKVYVATPAARILVTPNSALAGSTFTLDGTSSTADVGSIANYQWVVSKEGTKVNLKENNGGVVQAQLSEPGEYTVNLTIQDSSGKPDTATAFLVVESQEPVATYTYEVEESNQPSVVTFDARKSYDPDPKDVITYEWDFGGFEKEDYEIVEASKNQDQMTLRYIEKGEYKVVLTVKDQHKGLLQKKDTAEATVRINEVLDAQLIVSGEKARHLDRDGKAEVEMEAKSRLATALEIDYGDGTSGNSDQLSGGARESKVKFTHIYTQAGVFYVKLKALDDEGNFVEHVQRVYIGAGDAPIAVIGVAAQGEDIGSGPDFTGSTETKFTFSAAESLNVDGSNRNLLYSWNFGDGSVATQSNVTHTFSEHTVYEVLLTVTDKNNTGVSDQAAVSIVIENQAPRINGITVTPQGDRLVTPLKVNVTVDAYDPDGKLTYIKGWYYDVEDSATPLGTVIAQSNKFTLTVNTKGETDETKTYGFAVEVKDNANAVVDTFEALEEASIPTLDVSNGPNDTPIAAFSVDRSSAYTGESIVFSSTAYDPDGEIVNYWWDVEGDGFYNNEAQSEGSYEYAYNQVQSEGIQVKLKVEDNSGATAESKPITIYVDSIAEDPDAKFLANIEGVQVQFLNNSFTDLDNGAELTGVYWDFDLKMDSDGNGIKDDDFDSFDENPSHKYPEFGAYSVKMTVVDSVGQTDTVTQTIQINDAVDPIAAFKWDSVGKEVTFINNSEVDLESGVDVREYRWDFDAQTDADGDGDPANDKDSTDKNPKAQYSDFGIYEAVLTVEDSYGKTDTLSQTLELKDALEPVLASLSSVPAANSLGQVIMSENTGTITFNFTSTGGKDGEKKYVIDHNIFSDTSGDGVRDNDQDYRASEAGSFKGTFSSTQGQTVVKLTVTDESTGESDVATLQVVFPSQMGSVNLFNATPSDLLLLLGGALFAALVGVGLVARSKETALRR